MTNDTRVWIPLAACPQFTPGTGYISWYHAFSKGEITGRRNGRAIEVFREDAIRFARAREHKAAVR